VFLASVPGESVKEAQAPDMAGLADRHNRSGNGSMVVPAYYLDVVATRA
jgi:hypothetical protein